MLRSARFALIAHTVERCLEYFHVRQWLVDQIVNSRLIHHVFDFRVCQAKCRHQDNGNILDLWRLPNTGSHFVASVARHSDVH